MYVRPALAADLAHVHRLIVELAAYERAENEVTLSLDTFTQDFMAARFEVTVAVDHDKPSAWPCTPEVQHVERGDVVFGGPRRDRIVAGERGGESLFDEVVAVAQRRNAHRLEWQVLDWNAPAIGFYEELGAP